jgi:hypothetical protein
MAEQGRGAENVARLFSALLLTALAACASSRSSVPEAGGTVAPLPPQTLTTPPADAPTASEGRPDVPTPEGARSSRASDPTLIVIEPSAAEMEADSPSLAAAAARERQRRSVSVGEAKVLRITNENLAAQARGGVLTEVGGEPPAAAEDSEAAAAERGAEEQRWRQRGLEIRTRWRAAADSIPALVARADELRNRFYSTDDPAVRDGQIKPEWDRVLADLDEARYRVARGAEEVQAFLEEGRRAGALPGWLREGTELEPEAVVESLDGEVSEADPREPVVYAEPPERRQ